MILFINGLFHDLLNRVDKLRKALMPKFKEPDIDKAFLQETEDLLASLGDEISGKIASGDIGLEELATNIIIDFNVFYDKLTEIEIFRHIVIMSYNGPEMYFNAKIKRIYTEINNTQKRPLVTTTSNPNTYYWTMSAHNIIALPVGEEKSLLNLPDLYHEIGHMIYAQHGEWLRSPAIEAAVKAYYAKVLSPLNMPPPHKEYIKILREQKSLWLGHWIMEFCCDFIAVYLVGAAYAWTNFKLSTQGKPAELYKHEESHPSDEARMRGILIMLNTIGNNNTTSPIDSYWKDFLRAVNHVCSPPPGYDYECPDELMQLLANNVLEQCKMIGLRSYGEQVIIYGESESISHILNQAWQQVCSQAAHYKQWEEEQIKRIKKIVGFMH